MNIDKKLSSPVRSQVKTNTTRPIPTSLLPRNRLPMLPLRRSRRVPRLVLCAGAGGYAATRIYETEGIYLPPEQQNPESIAANIEGILDPAGQHLSVQGADQSIKFVKKAKAALSETA